MNREYPMRKYSGITCGRCGSQNTFTEQYPSQRKTEYWCNCGTELVADGRVWREVHTPEVTTDEDSS